MIYLTANDWLENLGADKYLELSAKLAQKKHKVREEIRSQKVQKDKTNTFDHYSYLSESGYKTLVNAMYADAGLELTATEVHCERFTADGKQPNGAETTWAFITTDMETGFSEAALVTGTGIDKGDKAVYKAHTGAMKYFAANNLLVATGDDAEAESPEAIIGRKTRKADDQKEFETLLGQVQRIKTEADEAGIDLREDAKIKEWVAKRCGVDDNNPKNADEAKNYIGAVRKLIDGKRSKNAQA